VKTDRLSVLAPLCLLAIAGGLAAEPAERQATSDRATYAYATNGVKDRIPGRAAGLQWKLLLDASNLGGTELEAAELTMAAGTETRNHTHHAVEVLYVLSGTYEHEVNGKRYRLQPGMIGIVRPGDQVRHLVPKTGDTRLLVLWAPAGEVQHLFASAQGTTPPPVPEVQK
jgi:quercetin dioxygenase-like cupin family protein